MWSNKLKGLLIVVSAPSGTGKTTLCHMLLKEIPTLEFSVSYTTRPPREGEVDGRDYHFVTKEQFERMIEEGDFLEWANVYGNLYGTSKSQVLKALEEGRDILLDIDTQGALQVKKNFPEAVLIFILPPSLEELERRLRKRGTDPEEVIERRLKTAREELKKALCYDYLVVNDELEKAFDQLKGIITAEKLKSERLEGQLNRLVKDPKVVELVEEGKGCREELLKPGK
ncbi:guanylate kinase [Thermovibrio ammonificans]|jgi:guanylate kinase|uniref:Guanylate kinase n=1 Tax=Thermovibrio ammonificans (strain DSM 15698 / JCM 12110 / HB-1) TaxID=648996 RepID=E8T436_THEA1|nr:guanylate kinase [Thermovibrio ammonificans]ADU97365.1 guanylate kinase [Thermovibrio ammonificans HB-1]